MQTKDCQKSNAACVNAFLPQNIQIVCQNTYNTWKDWLFFLHSDTLHIQIHSIINTVEDDKSNFWSKSKVAAIGIDHSAWMKCQIERGNLNGLSNHVEIRSYHGFGLKIWNFVRNES